MKVTNSLLTKIALVGVGAYKTYNDYKSAPKEQKNRTLFRDVATIGACALGVFKMDSFLSKTISGKKVQSGLENIFGPPKKNFIIKFAHKLAKILKTPDKKMEAVSNVIADCTNGFIVNMTGLFTGVGVGKAIDLLIFRDTKKIKNDKNEKPPEFVPYINPIEKMIYSTTPGKIIMNNRTKDIFFTTAGVFEKAGFFSNPLSKPLSIIENVNISKEKSTKKALEQSSTGIIVETLIPTVLISLANTFTADSKWFKKLPIVAATCLSGTYIADKIGNKMNQEVVSQKKQ